MYLNCLVQIAAIDCSNFLFQYPQYVSMTPQEGIVAFSGLKFYCCCLSLYMHCNCVKHSVHYLKNTLSLGNTKCHQVTNSLIDYLQHPDHHLQLSSIYALRYATSDIIDLSVIIKDLSP